jgi:hypothetical protein
MSSTRPKVEVVTVKVAESKLMDPETIALSLVR